VTEDPPEEYPSDPYPPPLPRPRWDCRNDEEREAFEAWTNEQLDQRGVDVNEPPGYHDLGFSHPGVYREDALTRAIAEANEGDLSGLIRLYPDLEPFLCLPTLRSSEHFPTPHELIPPPREQAAEDVVHMWTIWKWAFPGETVKQRRQKPTAVQIASRRNKVPENVVVSALNSRPKSRP
jgi:hypothetical protein